MIRSSKTSLKFTNQVKLDDLKIFNKEYSRTTQMFVDFFWFNQDKLSKLVPKDITDLIKEHTWLSQRAIQCSAKQASGIVRGTIKKHKQRLYVHEELVKDNKLKQARKLQKVIDNNPISKPENIVVNPELDSRFISMDFDNNTSFDGWITLTSLGNKLKIKLPIKKTKHFNHLSEKGQLKEGVRLSNNSITFGFEIPDKLKKLDGKTIGIDIGIKKVFVSSDNQISKMDKDGWNLTEIQKKIARRVKGSQGFKEAQDHRDNYIHWTLNQLNLNDVNQINLEKIKDLRRYKNTNRYMSHFTYTAIFDKVEALCEESGVQILRVSPSYTSQRCVKCGWVHKSNRKGEKFKCLVCGYTADADKNGSDNICLSLPACSRKRCLGHDNRVGFYWNVPDREPIVPYTKKANLHIFQYN